jgi:hypothetical protein
MAVVTARLCVCAALAAALGLGAAPDSVAGSKAVDLSSYLAGSATVGDFKYYARDDGGSEVVTTESVTETTKTLIATFAHAEDGKTSHQIEEQVARKELLVGSSYDDTFVFSRPHPQRLYVYSRFVPGKPQKYKLSATVLYQGARVARATTVGSTTFVGFEPITTPIGTFDQAAHFSQTATETIREKGRPDFVIVSSSETWIAKPYGTVYSTRQSSSFQNGVLQSSFGPHQYTFDHGVLHGVTVP